MLRVAVVAALAAILSAVFAPIALADTLCDNRYGTYCCNQTLGLLAALRLSGLETEVVEDVLRPRPVHADRERAWIALQRDKKVADGRVRLVLLEAPGRPIVGAELPEAEVRAALDALIAG